MELDLGKLLSQARQLTQDLEGRRAALSRQEVEGRAGAGLVTAVMNGAGDLLRVRVDPATFRGDQALVEDLIVAAVNAAIAEVQALQQRELAGLASSPGFLSALPKNP